MSEAIGLHGQVSPSHEGVPAAGMEIDHVTSPLSGLIPRVQFQESCGGISNRRFYRLLDKGTLKAVYVGGRLFLTVESIREWRAALPQYEPKRQPALQAAE